MATKELFIGLIVGLAVGAGGLYALKSKDAPAPMAKQEAMAPAATEMAEMAAVSFASGEAAIKYRKAVMKAVGGHMGSMGETLKNGDSLGAVAQHATAMADLARISLTVFPENSTPLDGKTEALPAVWDKPDDFKKVSMAFVAEAEKLAAAAKTGDKAAIGAQLGALGKNACKACHDDFREKK